MTESERTKARREADAALEHANQLVTRGVRIAQGWQRSRQDNNFRLMIRRLGQKVQESGT